AGARGNHDMGGLQRDRPVHRDLVVAHHAHVGRHLAQVLHEVPGEAVVVVQKQDHAAPPLPFSLPLTEGEGAGAADEGTEDARGEDPASATASVTARALWRVSSYSVCGTESATRPAPACT